jgi:hypothetical protein
MIEACTVWKLKQQMRKKQHYLTNMLLRRCYYNVWQSFKPNYKLRYLHALCIARRIKLFIMELGTKVAKYTSMKLKKRNLVVHNKVSTKSESSKENISLADLDTIFNEEAHKICRNRQMAKLIALKTL